MNDERRGGGREQSTKRATIPKHASCPAADAVNSRTQAKSSAPRTTSQSNVIMHTTTMHNTKHRGQTRKSTASAMRNLIFTRRHKFVLEQDNVLDEAGRTPQGESPKLKHTIEHIRRDKNTRPARGKSDQDKSSQADSEPKQQNGNSNHRGSERATGGYSPTGEIRRPHRT